MTEYGSLKIGAPTHAIPMPLEQKGKERIVKEYGKCEYDGNVL